jgi:hypothetical protein
MRRNARLLEASVGEYAVLAIVVFVNLHGDLVDPMSVVVPTVHQCHMWQHESGHIARPLTSRWRS